MIGERIKQVRERSHMTQNELADLIGTSRSVVANIENNRVKPREWFIRSICREFSINENWILNGNGDIVSSKTNNYDELLNDIISKLESKDDITIVSLINKITKLDDEYLPVIEKLIDGLIKD